MQQRDAIRGCFQQKQVRKTRWSFVTKRHIDSEFGCSQLRDKPIIKWVAHQWIDDCACPARLARTMQSFTDIPDQRFKRVMIHFR
ncbi:hypothetical protein ABW43_19425 [Stenotrophomonas maltophilia]|nr:hypothetical protein ABW43_19425 [Stenotrophomonas maltophilia]